MDRGELFKNQFNIEPVSSGFILVAFKQSAGPERLAFSTLDDLMKWLDEQRPVADLKKQAEAINLAKQQDALSYGILGGKQQQTTYPAIGAHAVNEGTPLNSGPIVGFAGVTNT